MDARLIHSIRSRLFTARLNIKGDPIAEMWSTRYAQDVTLLMRECGLGEWVDLENACTRSFCSKATPHQPGHECAIDPSFGPPEPPSARQVIHG